MKLDGWILVNKKDNTELKQGDIITDFRGDNWTLDSLSRGALSPKIVARDNPYSVREFNVQVFKNIHFIEEFNG